MKSQSLPITTIAIIIIAIIALVVVIIFVITGFGQAGEPTQGIIGIGGDKLTVSECVANGEYYCPIGDGSCVSDCADCGTDRVLEDGVCVSS